MNKATVRKFCSLLSALCYLLFLPLLVSAAPSLPYWGQGGLVSCNALTANNNTCDLCELARTFQNFVYFAITLVLFAFAPVMIAVGGFMVLVAGGSEERVSTGRSILKGAVVGLAIALGSFVIINTFLWAIGNGKNPTGVGWPNIDCGKFDLSAPVQTNQ